MGALTLAVTGATGYLGRAVVAQARARGHRVVVLLRNRHNAPAGWAGDAGIVLREGPLERLTPADFKGVDAVLHLAAALAGDDTTQARETIAPMRAILSALAGCEAPPRLVLASSMSVYGGMRAGETVTESTPLEGQPQHRDAYTRAKLEQETLAREHARTSGAPVALLRIGAVWGPGRLSNGHLGMGMGPVLLRMGSGGQIPLAHVDRAAAAAVLTAESPFEGVLIANVLDADLPDRARYVAALRAGGWPRWVLPLGWPLMRSLSILGSLPKMPGLLRAPVQRARIMPLSYASQAAWLHASPGEATAPSFESLMRAALAGGGSKTHG